jgi:hypothetical protein
MQQELVLKDVSHTQRREENISAHLGKFQFRRIDTKKQFFIHGSRILDLEVDVWRTCRSLLSIDAYLILKQTHAYNTRCSHTRESRNWGKCETAALAVRCRHAAVGRARLTAMDESLEIKTTLQAARSR